MKRLSVIVCILAVFTTIGWLALHSRIAKKSDALVDYSATDLSSGQRVSLEQYRGSPVLLTSWATWCTECKAGFPSLVKLWEAKKDQGLVIVAVNIDIPGEDRGIHAEIKKYDLTMPIWRDPNNRFAATFRALGTPTSVLIDSHGRLVKTWVGVVDFQSKEVIDIINTAFKFSK